MSDEKLASYIHNFSQRGTEQDPYADDDSGKYQDLLTALMHFQNQGQGQDLEVLLNMLPEEDRAIFAGMGAAAGMDPNADMREARGTLRSLLGK